MNNVSFSTGSKSCTALGLVIMASTAFSNLGYNDEQMTADPYYYENLAQSGSLKKVSILSKEMEDETTEQSEKERLALGECPSFIKNTFGLNVTDFSKILGISRPTAYKYLDGDVPDNGSGTIEHLYSLAKLWESKVGNLKLGMEFKRPYEGRSLYELLVSGEYDLSEAQIEKIAKVVNSRKERADKSLDRNAIRHNPDIVRHSVG
jgi:hypothetical protein